MQKNKKILIVFCLIVLLVVILFIFFREGIIPTNTFTKSTEPVLLIKEQNIQEQNFTGKKTFLVGDSLLAKTAEKYIEDSFLSFKERADADVPVLREQFGIDAPPSNYEYVINASEIKGNKTHSIVIEEYAYTGGANGMNTYKVFTATNNDQNILSIYDLIKADQQEAFTAFVKKKLIDFRPMGATEPVVFNEEVAKLKMDAFANFALDNQNLILFFQKYEVGPGALGAISLPIPLEELKNYLKD